MIDFTKIYQLKALKPKNKGHTKFYVCCHLTKKVYLMYSHLSPNTIFYSTVTHNMNFLKLSKKKIRDLYFWKNSKFSENWYIWKFDSLEKSIWVLWTPPKSKFIAVLKEEVWAIYIHIVIYEMLLIFRWGWKFNFEGTKNVLDWCAYSTYRYI